MSNFCGVFYRCNVQLLAYIINLLLQKCGVCVAMYEKSCITISMECPFLRHDDARATVRSTNRANGERKSGNVHFVKMHQFNILWKDD